MRKFIIFFFLIFSFVSKAESIESVLKKVQAVYSSNKMSYKMVYSLYKGHQSNIVHSSYQGELKMKNGQVYQKIKNTEFIYGNEFFLKINSEEKVIVLSKANSSFKSDVNIELPLKECISNVLKDMGSYYSITLKLNPISSVPCSVIKMRVDKKKYTILRMDFYYSSLQDFSTSYNETDMHQPHLKVEFSDINLSPVINSKFFELSSYIEIDKTILKPTGVYSPFELLDNRLN